MISFQRYKKLLSGAICLFALTTAGCGTSPAQQAGQSGTGAAPAPAAAQEQTIEHDLGKTVVSGEPKKILSLHPWISDFLISMDTTPSASPSAGPDSTEFTWYLKDGLKDSVNLGWQIPKPNLELIVQSSPDLIIGNQNFGELNDQLSKIAPTIFIEPVEDEKGVRKMRDTFLRLSKMLNKEEIAQKRIAEYNAEVEKYRTQVKAAIGDQTVMFLRVTDKELRYYSPKLFEVLYDDLAIAKPANIPDAAKSFQPLSIEKLPEVNPDYIFLLHEGGERVSSLRETAIWKGLAAVKNNRVFEVDYDLWFQGFGPIANRLILEDATERLLGTKAAK
ncbi:ABC transporter substrate-binding protein [Brevibacillus nitrificans]|uniref:ABC transporter substrate-binding protein n=1 Tax=Brevibacillus nitrificans TaxID=651560 RepID=A0A3M8DLP5_9BACL|nr:ABC transporter substrate-binding protein [Brevibacillus nitrificans]RNB88335.1 ABC transporter substrate-binding protein [Brevibacillus nitrificans]